MYEWIWSRAFWDGFTTGGSIFGWAEKGGWSCRKSEDEDLDGRNFRIGFEPLFVDFTDRGVVYIIFMLGKWFIQASVLGQ